jgi:hypothetical protein
MSENKKKQFIQYYLAQFIRNLILFAILCPLAGAEPVFHTGCEQLSDKDAVMEQSLGCNDCMYSSMTACLLERAYESKDVRYCQQLPGDSAEGNCVKRIAIEKKDYKLCYNLKHDDKYHSQQKFCLLWYAENLHDPDLCLKFFPGGTGSLLGQCRDNATKKENTLKK